MKTYQNLELGVEATIDEQGVKELKTIRPRQESLFSDKRVSAWLNTLYEDFWSDKQPIDLGAGI